MSNRASRLLVAGPIPHTAQRVVVDSFPDLIRPLAMCRALDQGILAEIWDRLTGTNRIEVVRRSRSLATTVQTVTGLGPINEALGHAIVDLFEEDKNLYFEHETWQAFVAACDAPDVMARLVGHARVPSAVQAACARHAGPVAAIRWFAVNAEDMSIDDDRFLTAIAELAAHLDEQQGESKRVTSDNVWALTVICFTRPQVAEAVASHGHFAPVIAALPYSGGLQETCLTSNDERTWTNLLANVTVPMSLRRRADDAVTELLYRRHADVAPLHVRPATVDRSLRDLDDVELIDRILWSESVERGAVGFVALHELAHNRNLTEAQCYRVSKLLGYRPPTASTHSLWVAAVEELRAWCPDLRSKGTQSIHLPDREASSVTTTPRRKRVKRYVGDDDGYAWDLKDLVGKRSISAAARMVRCLGDANADSWRVLLASIDLLDERTDIDALARDVVAVPPLDDDDLEALRSLLAPKNIELVDAIKTVAAL